MRYRLRPGNGGVQSCLRWVSEHRGLTLQNGHIVRDVPSSTRKVDGTTLNTSRPGRAPLEGNVNSHDRMFATRDRVPQTTRGERFDLDLESGRG